MGSPRGVVIGYLALCVLVLLGTAMAIAESEPNDDRSQANDLTSGGGVGFVDHVQDPEDWYKFDAGNGDMIFITLESWNNTIMNLTLFDPNDNMVMVFFSNGPVAMDHYYTEYETPVDTWYVRLTSINGWYEFTVNITKQDDALSGRDVLHSTNAPRFFPATGVWHRAYMGDMDWHDYYAVNVSGGHILSVEFVEDQTVAMNLNVYNASLTLVDTLSSSNGVHVSSTWAIPAATPNNRMWWLEFTPDTGSQAETYRFIINQTSQDDAGTGGDVPGDAANAHEVTLGGNGYVGRGDGADAYKFLAGNGDIIECAVRSLDGTPITMRLLNNTEVTMGGAVSNGAMIYDYLHTEFETPVEYWYIIISGEGNYVFIVNLRKQDDAGSGRDTQHNPPGCHQPTKGERHMAFLGDLDECDYYKVAVVKRTILTVGFTSNDTVPINLHVYDENMVLVDSLSTSSTIWKEGSYEIDEATPDGSFWHIKFTFDPNFQAREYYFEISESRQNDAGTGSDVGEGPDDAHDIDDHEGNVTGYVDEEDPGDAYTFEAGNGDIIICELRWLDLNPMTLTLLDPDENHVWDLETSGPTNTEAWYTEFETPVDHWYIIITGEGSYEFAVETNPQGDADSGRDTQHAPDGCHEPALGVWHEADMGDLDWHDYYRVRVSQGYVLAVTFEEDQSVPMNLHVYDEGMTLVDSLASSGGVRTSDHWTIPPGTPADSYWFLEFTPDTGSTAQTYYFEIHINTSLVDDDPPEVEYEAPERVENDEDLVMTITLNDTSEVTRVTLTYRFGEEGTWKSVNMTSAGGSDWTVTIPSDELEEGKLYYYIEAEDVWGNVESYGTLTSPKEMQVTKPPEDDEPGFQMVVAVMAVLVAVALCSRRRMKG